MTVISRQGGFETNPYPAAVFRNELDACLFQSMLYVPDRVCP
jgi:hypothetical protein